MGTKVLVKKELYTVDEYFNLEERSNNKSEFRNGKIITMAGGTYAHNKISLNIAIALALILDVDFFDVISNDQAIYIPEHHHFVYSDTAVLKGEPLFYKKNKRAVLNPILVFEVTSRSTEKYDRFAKFNKYKSIESFEEYVLVDQEMPLVEVFSKKENEEWLRKSYIGLDENIHLSSVNCDLKMADLYKKVKDLLDPQMMIEIF
ncbi:MAG: Uma2 family endonuclease [Saprospiraceae bacterium]